MLAVSRYKVISEVNKEANGKADGASYPISPARAHESWKR